MMHAANPVTQRWARFGIRLVIATLAYNVLEACVALWSGMTTRSIALVGFGLDSVIETVAAGVLLWRLRLEARGAPPVHIEAAEHRVHRVVGGTFLALALYVLGQAGWMLWHRDVPDESLIGAAVFDENSGWNPQVLPALFRVALHGSSSSQTNRC